MSKRKQGINKIEANENDESRTSEKPKYFYIYLSIIIRNFVLFRKKFQCLVLQVCTKNNNNNDDNTKVYALPICAYGKGGKKEVPGKRYPL